MSPLLTKLAFIVSGFEAFMEVALVMQEFAEIVSASS